MSVVIKIPCRAITACEHFESPTVQEIALKLDAELKRQIHPEASCARLIKIRKEGYDYLHIDMEIPQTITPGSYPSPIAPLIAALIIAIVKFVVAPAIIAAVVLWVLNWIGGMVRPPVHCPYCGKEFSDPAQLQAHIASEHPDKPKYVCPYCGLPFNTPEELAKHMKECPAGPAKIPWEWIIGGMVATGAIILVAEIVRRTKS